MIRPCLALVVLFACALLGCPSGDDAPAAPGGATAAAPPAGEVEPDAPPIQLLDAGEVKPALQAWLEAQNQGDFEAYSGLYASRFFGIKRSGPRTYQYKRDGWLKDRERMFGKQMVVEADKVEISTSRQTAQVRFMQTWSSGTYKDVGPKQLVFTREDGRLLIAREEMLASKLVDTEGTRPVGKGDPGLFMFVEELDGGLWLVLEQDVDESLGQGKPHLVSRSPAAARKTGDPSQISVEATAMQGRVVALYGDSGKVCKATVGEIQVITRFWPHFGMVQTWDGEFDPDWPKPSEKEIAEEIWGMGPKALWARLETTGSGNCGAARWARDATLADANVFEPAPAVAASIEATAIRSLRKLRGHREIQKDYEQLREEADASRWWDEYDGGKPEVIAFTDAASGRTWAGVRALGGYGCGGFYGEFWALWEVKSAGGEPTLELLTDERTPGSPLFMPTTGFDLDGDGVPEFLDETTLVEKIGPYLESTQINEVPSYDCPC
jgi:hypothetical protein